MAACDIDISRLGSQPLPDTTHCIKEQSQSSASSPSIITVGVKCPAVHRTCSELRSLRRSSCQQAIRKIHIPFATNTRPGTLSAAIAETCQKQIQPITTLPCKPGKFSNASKNISFKSRFLGRCQPRWKCQRDREQDAKALPAQPPISVKTTSSQQLGQLHGCNTDPVRGSHCVFFPHDMYFGFQRHKNISEATEPIRLAGAVRKSNINSRRHLLFT